jgi:WD40 repeat protein
MADKDDLVQALTDLRETMGSAKKQEKVQEEAGYAEQLTPRTKYSDEKNTAEQMSLQLMVHLSADRISSMEKEFSKRDGGVDLNDFVMIMMSHLPEYLDGDLRPEMQDYGGKPDWRHASLQSEGGVSRVDERQLVLNLYELFREIDINGDGTLEWDELISFIVEKAMMFKERYRVSELGDYHQRKIGGKSEGKQYRHNNCIEKLHYIPRLHQCAVIEQHSPVVTLYNARNNKLVANLQGHRGVPMAMQYVQKLDTLVTCCADMTMVAWNMANDSTQYTVRNCWPTPHVQMAMCWDDHHDLLYSGSTAGMLHAWSVQDREERTCLHGHNDIVMDLISMPSLDNIASASLDTTIAIWDTYTGARLQEFRGHTKGVFSLSYNPDYRMLVSAGFDHDAFIWSPFVPTLLYKLKGHTGSLVGVESVPGTPEVITADSNGYFKLWDLRNFQCVQTWTDDSGLKGMNSFVHCGEKMPRVIAATKKLHFFQQGSSVVEPVTDANHISCACYNSNSLTIMTCTGQDVKIWNALSGTQKHYFKQIMPSEITASCLDDRKRKFILGDDQGNICVFNYMNGAMMKSMNQQGGEILKLIYCMESKAVLSLAADKAIVVHDEMDPEKGNVLRMMDLSQQHTDDITCIALSHPTSLIASGSNDRTVRVWDFETGKLDGILKHDAPLAALHFLADLPLLVAADASGVIKVWGVRMTSFKYECCFSFLHGKPEPGVNYNFMKDNRGRSIFFPDIQPTSDPVGPLGVLTAEEEADEARAAEEAVLQAKEEEDAAAQAKADKKAAAKGGAKADKKGGAKEAKGEGEAKAESKEERREAEAKEAEAKVEAEAKAKADTKAAEERVPLGRHSAARGPSLPLAISFDPERKTLYTGDDNGCVQAWGIRTMIEESGVTPVALPDATRMRRRASYVPRVSQSAAPSVSGCVHKWSVQGHTDCVTELEFVPEPECVMTSSYDRCVRMWDNRGYRYGTLLQGVANGHQRNPEWDVPVDVGKRKVAEEMTSTNLMAQLWKRDGGGEEDEAGEEALVVKKKMSSMFGMAAPGKFGVLTEEDDHDSSAKRVDGAQEDPDNKEERAAEEEAAEEARLEAEAKHSRVMVALHHTNNMQQGSYPEDQLDQEIMAQERQQHESDVDFTEYQAFKSSLPPIDSLSTNTFVKLGQQTRGSSTMQIAQMKNSMKEKAMAMTSSKEQAKLRDGVRSSSSLVQSGKLAMTAHMQAAAAAPPPQPTFSEESKASVAFLAKAISDWHQQGGDGDADPESEEAK